MKVATHASSPGDPPVWKALADPTRRAILDLLRQAPLTCGRIAACFDISRFGVRKHLLALEQAGLVLVEQRGRERWNHLNPVPLRQLYRRWIRPFEEHDSDRLLRIKQLAEQPGTREEAMTTMTENPSLTVRNILVEVLIEAPVEHVWKTMAMETSAWWHRDFYTGPTPRGFHIEPVLGGRMYEDWGDGSGLIWGTVNGLRAPEYLQIIGDSSKEWGGPNRSIMTWTLEADGESPGTTRLRLEHSVFGNVSKETEASLESGWLQLFGDCMKPYAETGKRPPEALAASGGA